MNALMFQVMMLISVPSEQVPELIRYAIEHHCSYETALQLLIEERVQFPGYYGVYEVEENEE
jgi:hypothetical protein